MIYLLASQPEKLFQIPRHNTPRLHVSHTLFDKALEHSELPSLFSG